MSLLLSIVLYISKISMLIGINYIRKNPDEATIFNGLVYKENKLAISSFILNLATFSLKRWKP